jgi:hypothetical protein
MKKLLNVLTFLIFALSFGQMDNIDSGEKLIYRIHYGFLNAGTAELTSLKTNYQNLPHFFVKGVGKTTGAVRAFFKVDDLYESFINISTGLPSFYVRDVHEGNYSQHFESVFNHNNETVILTDKENAANGSKIIKTVKGVQDMLSAFYYLRSLDSLELRTGSVVKINIWIDKSLFPFQLRVVGTENLKTDFGTINCLKIIPSVISGRVFKDNESVTMWVTNDKNHLPIALKADLAVGSLKADIDSFKNVKYPLSFRK